MVLFSKNRISSTLLFFTILTVLISSCVDHSERPEKKGPKSLSLGYLEAPAGFEISVYADNVPNARQLAMSPNGILYVGTRQAGKVYAVVDTDNDFKADTVYTIAEGMKFPSGVAFRNGSLYVADISTIWRYDNIDENLNNPPEPVLVTDEFPSDTHHGWKNIAFGPDDKLYVPVGAPCNICNKEEENPLYASLTRINPDGTGKEIIAKGIRNTVGFAWHPETNNIWFTDNGRDWLGDDTPSCELNEITEEGQHFGFPYLHANDVWDPEFGDAGKTMNTTFKKPILELGPHVAPLGIIFYTGEMFPSAYENTALIAQHGSWNRSEKIGYRVMQVRFNDDGSVKSYEPFITGWLQNGEDVKGRPVSIIQLEDGSLLISDDNSGTIYRVTYKA